MSETLAEDLSINIYEKYDKERFETLKCRVYNKIDELS
jgi:hypothetical protein